ncbi:MAG: CaiB/BaiF CoA transferase family protein [Beijerinckiaceae bacterium]
MDSHSREPDRGAVGGPLRGLKVVEFAGIGPGPFATMLLADMGADVVCINRPGQTKPDPRNFVQRGRCTIELDLKDKSHVGKALDLVAAADILIEGFRPHVMERLGLGPDVALARNPRLVYGRMTGWGQTGPLSQVAGHDIDYIAITGALDAFRAPDGEPVSPLNLVGDYGGGALYLVVGVLAAFIEAKSSGHGQVVDAAMCDGVTSMLTMFQSMRATKFWTDAPRKNLLDGGAPFYRPHECKDGRYIAVGALEPQFYAKLRELAGLSSPIFDSQSDRSAWPKQQAEMAAIFKTKTRDEWCELFGTSDACVAPIISLAEAPNHPHLVARETYVEHDGHLQPAPAPRFSRTPSTLRAASAAGAVDADKVIAKWSK